MKATWYIYSKQVVSGPYSTESVESGLKNSHWNLDSLIWWKGQVEWISLEAWRKNLENILESLKTSVQKTVWYVEHLGMQKGPMNVNELQQYVLQNGLLSSCRVWTTGMDSWKSVFELPELVNFMGITRRMHPRAPIKGEALIHNPSSPIVGPLGTISEGGIGIKNIQGMQKGDSLQLTIKSPMLVGPIHSRAQVVYASSNGITGLQFQNLQPEFQSTIVDFVKQFKS
jgi:hypothetical protein